ncbi:MAG: four-helix bundle copper-binding protein [Anaerolineae bacterium]|nr:four-helix bundle copper-binding protein [Anaerolineae bacterium]
MAQRTPVLDYPAFIPTDLQVEFCVDDCLDCMRACERAAIRCLRGLPLTWMVVYNKTLLECGDLAQRTAIALARNNEDALDLADLCAQSCTVMARECDAFDDRCFRVCAEACRRCAESCREISG